MNMNDDKPKHAGGRPPKLTPELKQELLACFKSYIDEHEDPTVVGFVSHDAMAIEYEISRENINDWTEFSPLKKLALAKQEAFLVTQNSTMAIFRLKQPQHGFKDRYETDITTKGEAINAAAVDPVIANEFTAYLKQRTLGE